MRGVFAASVLTVAGFCIAGCASESSGVDLTGRPLVYKVGPGDPPSTIHTKAGVVYKERTSEPAPAAESARPTQVARAEAPPPAPPAAAAPTAPPVAAAAPAPVAAPAPAPTATAPLAAAVAPSTLDSRYTQASRYGDLLFLSGQIAIDLSSGELIADRSIEAQTQKVMENIQRILEANGLTMANVLSTQVFLRNINNVNPMDSVYRKFFKGAPPARTIVEVSNLPRGMEVQISAVAGK